MFNKINLYDKQYKILVVDDDENIRLMLNQLLTSKGYIVVEASNGQDAIEIFKNEHVDLIILDAMMPILDGISACEIIRKLPNGNKVPILIITALTDENIVELAIKADASDFITKPFNFNVLLEKIKSLIKLYSIEKYINEINTQKNIVELVNDGIITLNSNKQIISYNNHAEKIFLFNFNEVFNKKIEFLIPELDDKFFNNYQTKSYKNIKSFIETKGIKKNGEYLWLRILISYTNQNDVLLVIHDLTNFVKFKESVKINEIIFNNIKEAICTLDENFNIKTINLAFTKITDYQLNEVIDSPFNNFFTNNSFDINNIQSLLDQNNGQISIETEIISKFNKKIPIYMIINKIDYNFEHELMLLKYIVIFHDNSYEINLKNKEYELKQNAIFVQKMMLLSSIAAGIVHEVNQPLNSIKILADSILGLKERNMPIDLSIALNNFAKISEYVNNASNIINRMREFASNFNPNVNNEYCDLNLVLEKVYKNLRFYFEKENINFSKINLANKNSYKVNGNEKVIEDAISNLIFNAIQAFKKKINKNEKKEIICRLNIDNLNAILEISDNATGIDENIKEQIFDPLFSTKSLSGGLGLGLSIVKSIINGYDGTINVLNNKNGGATFIVKLPLKE